MTEFLDYKKYRTLAILPDENKAEYERLMLPDPVKGADVHAMITISSKEATTGVEKELDVVIDGVAKTILVNIPAGMKNGYYMRYREKGEAGKWGGKNGDLFVRVVVELPIDSEQEKEPESQKSQEQSNLNAMSVDITFMEAVNGIEKEIRFMEKVPCKKCNGTGRLKKKSCAICKGSGQLDEWKRIRVKIPAGIDDRQILRLRKQENKLKQDLYVEIHVQAHPKFTRKGSDIYSTEKIPFHVGNGRMIGIDTLDGKQYYNVTKDTKDGTTIRLKNKGVPTLKNPSGRGDHYVTWKK